jgi:6-pyruvoyltetrahydropterin/6-carboxytetrahydropterin synthase
MPTAYLSRRAVFSASHRLHSEDLSDDENRALFGKCNNPNGHGHNYVVEVVVRGEIDPATGIVMNLADLKGVIDDTVMRQLDHRNLNTDVEALRGLNPTAERIAVAIWKMLEPRIEDATLHEIRLHETENNVVVYRGE